MLKTWQQYLGGMASKVEGDLPWSRAGCAIRI